jgi:hypothetical protein
MAKDISKSAANFLCSSMRWTEDMSEKKDETVAKMQEFAVGIFGFLSFRVAGHCDRVLLEELSRGMRIWSCQNSRISPGGLMVGAHTYGPRA